MLSVSCTVDGICARCTYDSEEKERSGGSAGRPGIPSSRRVETAWNPGCYREADVKRVWKPRRESWANVGGDAEGLGNLR